MKKILLLAISLLILGINNQANAYVYSSEGIETSGYYNNDVYIDLAIVNPGYNTVSIRTGTGSGTFNTAVNYATGTNPQAVTSANLNGDAYTDLIIANAGSNTVSILMGGFGGVFSTQVTYGTSSTPVAVVSGDLDNDSDIDLAVVNDGNGTVGILMNNGNGTFATQTTYSVGAGHGEGGIAIGDFDGDGYKDLAVVNNDDSNVGVLLNNGNGTFATQVTYDVGNRVSTTGGVSVGDMNNDSKLDLAVVNSNANTVSILNGNGDGTFDDEICYGVQDSDESGIVAFADFNSDSYLDLAVINPGSDTISILINNGNNTYASTVDYSTFVEPKSVAVGDFNGDGYLDLAIASTSSSIKFYAGSNDGTFY